MTERSLRTTKADKSSALLVDLGCQVGRDGEVVASDRPCRVGERDASGREQASRRVERARRSRRYVVVCEQCGLRLARRERVGDPFVQSLAAGRTDRREHRIANERMREGESFGAELGEESLAAQGLHHVEELLGRDRRARLDGRELELVAGDRRERERRREIIVKGVEPAGDRAE